MRRPSPRAASLLCAVLLAGCAALPTDYPRTESHADLDTSDTRLGRAVAPLVNQHPGLTGIHLIARGSDAFAARMVLAEAAQRSLDMQYFIWHRDTTGRLLADAVLRAADRGVRVRLLLDDVGTGANDADLLLLDAHPGIELRLFNPLANRDARMASFLLDFTRANRRMHNKSFIADNQVTILGGRNIGDEYFEARSDVDFRDRDLVAIGPVVPQVSSQFDLYWNSDAAVPVAALGRDRPGAEAVAQARAELQAFVEAQRESAYVTAVRGGAIVRELTGRSLSLSWGPGTVLYDDPAKIRADSTERATHLAPKLRSTIDAVRDEVILVSPYFVPGESGVALLRGMRERGVRVWILTNSLASTDVAAVHSGYQRYRRPLLEAGVELYEAKATARRGAGSAVPRRGEAEGARHVMSGSARAALHAKSMIYDRRVVFLGSMNLDPRSLFVNTEIGVLVQNAEVARLLVDEFDRAVAVNAYRLVLSRPDAESASRVEWVTQEGGAEARYTSEPLASAWQRFKVWLLSLLPIEPLL
ncbi:MAG: phospholipase D family protein [Candidatus Rokuibacteriota bacterium]